MLLSVILYCIAVSSHHSPANLAVVQEALDHLTNTCHADSFQVSLCKKVAVQVSLCKKVAAGLGKMAKPLLSEPAGRNGYHEHALSDLCTARARFPSLCTRQGDGL